MRIWQRGQRGRSIAKSGCEEVMARTSWSQARARTHSHRTLPGTGR